MVSEHQLLWAFFSTGTVVCFLLTWRLEGGRLREMAELGRRELGMVAVLGVGINWGNNMVQQVRAAGSVHVCMPSTV